MQTLTKHEQQIINTAIITTLTQNCRKVKMTCTFGIDSRTGYKPRKVTIIDRYNSITAQELCDTIHVSWLLAGFDAYIPMFELYAALRTLTTDETITRYGDPTLPCTLRWGYNAQSKPLKPKSSVK